MTLTGQRTAAFPQELFYMCYMDMKTGEQYGVLDDAGQLEDESKPAKLFAPTDFTFTFTNPKFRYDPNTNTITVSPGYSTSEACDVTITWKNAALAFTSKPISRTLHIDWDDPKEARYIAFDTRGGSAVKAISLVGGAPIPTVAKPTKQGYTFAWWTTDEAGSPTVCRKASATGPTASRSMPSGRRAATPNIRWSIISRPSTAAMC